MSVTDDKVRVAPPLPALLLPAPLHVLQFSARVNLPAVHIATRAYSLTA